jgi:hypothetical protein
MWRICPTMLIFAWVKSRCGGSLRTSAGRRGTWHDYARSGWATIEPNRCVSILQGRGFMVDCRGMRLPKVVERLHSSAECARLEIV